MKVDLGRGVSAYISDEGIRKVDKALRKQVAEMIGNRLKDLIIEEIMGKQIWTTGHLAETVHVVPSQEKVSIRAKYAGYVEYGTKPRGVNGKYPPYRKIRAWVGNKFGYSGREARNVTWAIMQKIKMEGTPARHYIRDAIRRLKKEYKGRFNVEF